MNIFQRAVAPQPQSLCFAAQRRQSQYSHQIHLRWFTSSTKSATIQRRISVRDTPPKVRAGRPTGNGPGGPNEPPLGPRRSRRLPAAHAGASDAPGEKADEPDEGDDRGHDEEPMDDEPGPEG